MIAHRAQRRWSVRTGKSLLLVCLGLGLNQKARGFSEGFIEGHVSHGTDALGLHPFLNNPSNHKPKGLEASVFLLQDHSRNAYEEFSVAGDLLSARSNTSAASHFALAFGADMGSGLFLGLSQQMVQAEESNKNSARGNAEFLESFDTQFTNVRAVVELSDSLDIGISLRFLDAQRSLVGSFSVQPSALTDFKPSMFGSGGGLHFSSGDLQLGAAYIPAMKGKAEIYAEEKIITLPGVMEVTASADLKSWVAGFGVRRFVYKHDDRGEGTTLNDQNQTAINLYGLNVDHSLFFAREQKQVGVDWVYSTGATFRTSLSQWSVEHNPRIATSLPGEEKNNPLLTYYLAQVLFQLEHKNLTWQLGANLSLRKDFTFRSSGREIHYQGQEQGILLGLLARL